MAAARSFVSSPVWQLLGYGADDDDDDHNKRMENSRIVEALLCWWWWPTVNWGSVCFPLPGWILWKGEGALIPRYWWRLKSFLLKLIRWIEETEGCSKKYGRQDIFLILEKGIVWPLSKIKLFETVHEPVNLLDFYYIIKFNSLSGPFKVAQLTIFRFFYAPSSQNTSRQDTCQIFPSGI